MPFARIWYEPDGSVRITTYHPDADPEQVNAVLVMDGRVHKDATFDDVADEETLNRLLPADKGTRERWRKDPDKPGVIVAAVVSEPR